MENDRFCFLMFSSKYLAFVLENDAGKIKGKVYRVRKGEIKGKMEV